MIGLTGEDERMQRSSHGWIENATIYMITSYNYFIDRKKKIEQSFYPAMRSQFRCIRDNSSITFFFLYYSQATRGISHAMETRGQSKQKWEQVNLRNFQRVKVQISGIAIPDIIPIPSHTYRVFNPNSRITLSHISKSLNILPCVKV